MRNSTALRPVVAVTLSFALLTGCSLLGDGPGWGGKKGADKDAPAVPTLPEPVPTHTFEIEPTTDIVGVVQKTQAAQGRHAHRHRAPLQRRLRGNRARKSGRRPVAAG